MIPTSRRARLTGLAVLFAIFLVGGFVGAAVDRALSVRPAVAETGEQDRNRDERRGSILDELTLTPDQEARVDRIMARRRSEMEAFWDTAGPRLRSIADSARAEVRAVLTPEQQVEYDRIRAERRARHRKQHDDGGREDR